MDRNILEKIVEDLRPLLAQRKERISGGEMERLASRAVRSGRVISFADAFKHETQVPRIIAELKKASPSKGLIRENFVPTELAVELEQAGAAGLSVLTEPNYFQGDLSYLASVREVVKIPLLRKDFIFDPYQVYEARVNGASAILLIAALLSAQQLNELAELAISLGLDVLGEAHNEAEVDLILESPATLVGVNARNLKTFQTNLDLVSGLIQRVPSSRIPIAESAIRTREDIQKLWEVGAAGFLIGETLMRAKCPGEALKKLL